MGTKGEPSRMAPKDMCQIQGDDNFIYFRILIVWSKLGCIPKIEVVEKQCMDKEERKKGEKKYVLITARVEHAQRLDQNTICSSNFKMTIKII